MPEALSHYETLSILNADLSDDALKGIITSATAIIEEGSGTIHKVDEWGRRRLAYPILKRNDGFYFLMTYSSAIEPRREMERRFKLNEDVMRTQTIVIDEAAVEAVKESIVKEAEAKKESAAREEAAKVEAAAKEEAKAAAKESEAKAAETKDEEPKATEPKDEGGIKQATEIVKEAAKAAPAPDEKEPEVDPALKEASDLVEAAAKAAPAPASKNSVEESPAEAEPKDEATDEGGSDE